VKPALVARNQRKRGTAMPSQPSERKIVGPKICYAFIQSVGLVNDHIVGCFRRRPSAK
jgi:3-methyladenine DNA glycosylase Tag